MIILAAACLCAASNKEPARSPASIPAASKLCARGPVGFHQLRSAIAKYLNLCKQAALCKGQLTSVETKVLAGYSKPWLWNMTTTGSQTVTPFSVTAQDNFIASAKALAQTALPAGKTITNIDVFTDIVPAMHVTGHYVGARATYGICTAVKQPN